MASPPAGESHPDSADTPSFEQGRSDTVTVSRAVLARALANPNACRSPDGDRGLWSNPPSVVQAGRALLLADGRLALLDFDAKVLRVYGPDGHEVATLGRSGSGPGEFIVTSVTLSGWAGDTIAAHDIQAARISLFTNKGFARALRLGDIGELATGGYMGRFDDGTVLFGVDLNTRDVSNQEGLFRPSFRVIRWHPGASNTQPLRAGILGPERYPYVRGKKVGAFSTNFPRKTSISALGNQAVIYDSALPHLLILGLTGQVVRVITFDVEDPPVSQTDRDSVLSRLREESKKSPIPPDILKILERFPKTRAAAFWKATDYGNGIWLGFTPPVAMGSSPVYIRFTADGTPTHCLRSTTGKKRLVAFAPDRVATISENEEGDVVNLERTVAFPSR